MLSSKNITHVGKKIICDWKESYSRNTSRTFNQTQSTTIFTDKPSHSWDIAVLLSRWNRMSTPWTRSRKLNIIWWHTHWWRQHNNRAIKTLSCKRTRWLNRYIQYVWTMSYRRRPCTAYVPDLSHEFYMVLLGEGYVCQLKLNCVLTDFSSQLMYFIILNWCHQVCYQSFTF